MQDKTQEMSQEMTQEMQVDLAAEVKIVEYDPTYAQGVADMWNASGSGWNDRVWNSTPETVRNQEKSSAHLNLYLALLGDKVVGYLKLSKYAFDEKTLYIDLLNVVPAYHGAKIGKQLVLRAVARTVELGYPRLDLFTWAGNTKAIPLYKKCGFFWEKMDKNATHLMNFMPQALANPLVSDFFASVDWYDASTRLIDREPDGEISGPSGDFEHYNYVFENRDECLTMTYEKTGRGLVAIKRRDYEISLEIPGNKLVFGQSYPLTVRLVNHSSAPLALELCHVNTGLVTGDLHFCGEVPPGETRLIEGLMTLGTMDKEQDPWITHPSAQVSVAIKGQTTVLKAGINFKSPLKMKLNRLAAPGRQLSPTALLPTGVPLAIAVDLQNNFKEQARFTFNFKNTANCTFFEPHHSVTLAPSEKRSLITSVILGGSDVGIHSIDVVAVTEGAAGADGATGTTVEFVQPCGLALFAEGGKVCGATAEKDYMQFGKYLLSCGLESGANGVGFMEIQTQGGLGVMTPRIALGSEGAFSSELDQLVPVRFTSEDLGGTLVRKHHYESVDNPGLNFARCFSLTCNGHLRVWYELEGLPAGDSADCLRVNQRMAMDSQSMILPYRDKLLTLDLVRHGDSGLSALVDGGLCENWILSKVYSNQGPALRRSVHTAVVWPEGLAPSFCDWYFSFALTLVQVGDVSPAVEVFIDGFENTEDLRIYASSRRSAGRGLVAGAGEGAGAGEMLRELRSVDSCYMEVNGGNPIVSFDLNGGPRSIPVEIVDLRQKPIEALCTCSLEAAGHREAVSHREVVSQVVDREMDKHVIGFDLEVKCNDGLQLVSHETAYDERVRRDRHLCMVVPSGGSDLFTSRVYEEAGHQVYEIGNGLMTLKSSPTFGAAVYSLVYNGREWLDTDFPNVTSRSWYSPWYGGLRTRPSYIPNHAFAKEEVKVRFVEEVDGMGNVWQGLAIDVEVQHFALAKGLGFTQYFLMQPGVPVLAQFYVIAQNTGAYMDTMCFGSNFFNMPSPIFSYDHEGEMIYKKGENDTNDDYVLGRLISIRTANESVMIHHFMSKYDGFAACKGSNLTSTDVEDTLQLPSGSTFRSMPTFLVLSDRELREGDFAGWSFWGRG